MPVPQQSPASRLLPLAATESMTVQDIPALNAALNGLATVLITLGFVQIKRAQRQTEPLARVAQIRTHRALMLAAGGVSAVFLVGYVTHKILMRGVHTPFGGIGGIRSF